MTQSELREAKGGLQEAAHINGKSNKEDIMSGIYN